MSVTTLEQWRNKRHPKPMPPEDWREANRIVLGWGAPFPPIPWHRRFEEWRGCRGVTQQGQICMVQVFGSHGVCHYHHDLPEDRGPRPGYEESIEPIYFVAGAGLVKIGKGPLTRARSHQTSSPVPLKVLRCLVGPARSEKTLHWIFDDVRVRGEWFQWNRRLRRMVYRLTDEQIRTAIGWAQRPEDYKLWTHRIRQWQYHRAEPQYLGEHPDCIWARNLTRQQERKHLEEMVA